MSGRDRSFWWIRPLLFWKSQRPMWRCSPSFRHQRDGLVNDETRRRMQLLTPHVRRAVLIGGLLDHKKSEAAQLADTFDGLSAGMFLVDGSGRIVHANTAGHVMINRARVLGDAGRATDL